jgi:hypothetical protein
MKLANVKGLIAKGMLLTFAAGALILGSPVKAEAQRFVVGVQVGNPYYAARDARYDRDQYDRHDYARYDYGRQEEFLRRQAFFRHQEWLRQHDSDRSYGYR